MEEIMTKINLREQYPDFYKTDYIIEVPDEVAAVMKEHDRLEAAYRRRTYYHKAHTPACKIFPVWYCSYCLPCSSRSCLYLNSCLLSAMFQRFLFHREYRKR